MTPPLPSARYPWSPAGALAHALAAPVEPLEHATTYLSPGELSHPLLSALCKSLFSLDDLAHERELPAAPDPHAGTPDQLAWARAALATGGIWAVGRVVGMVIHAYAHRGWGVLAAAAAAGDDADRLGSWDELVPQVSNELGRRFARAVLDRLAVAAPSAAALAEAGWSAPGAGLVASARMQLATELAALPAPDRRRPDARFHDALDGAAAWLGGTAVAASDVVRDAHDGRGLVAGALRRADAWTWSELAAWRGGDPLAGAKAIARTVGLGACVAMLEDVRGMVADELDAAVADAWSAAIDQARAALAGEPTPLVDAIVALVEHAVVDAAARIGEAVAAGHSPEDLAALLAELLGDPRANPRGWEPRAPGVRAALEAA